ncbi:MAG: hypothetical protein AAB605_01595 [Patescibacteria group bacterium]
MKNILIILLLVIIAVGGYYFWLMQQAEEAPQEERGAVLQGAIDVPQPQKYIPPGAVMEDGTI